MAYEIVEIVGGQAAPIGTAEEKSTDAAVEATLATIRSLENVFEEQELAQDVQAILEKNLGGRTVRGIPVSYGVRVVKGTGGRWSK